MPSVISCGIMNVHNQTLVLIVLVGMRINGKFSINVIERLWLTKLKKERN